MDQKNSAKNLRATLISELKLKKQSIKLNGKKIARLFDSQYIGTLS